MFNDTTGNVTTNNGTSGNATFSPTFAPSFSVPTIAPNARMDAAGWLGTTIPEPFLPQFTDVPYAVKLIFPLIGIGVALWTLLRLKREPVAKPALMSHMNTAAFCIAFLLASVPVAAFYYLFACVLTPRAYYGNRFIHLLLGFTILGLGIATVIETVFYDAEAAVWTYVSLSLVHFLAIRSSVDSPLTYSALHLKRIFFIDAAVSITVGIALERRIADVTWITFGIWNLFKAVLLFRYHSAVDEEEEAAAFPPGLTRATPSTDPTDVIVNHPSPAKPARFIKTGNIGNTMPTVPKIDMRYDPDGFGDEDVTARI